MKTEVNQRCCNNLRTLTSAEAAQITGGGSIKNYVNNVASALSREGGGVNTLVFGLGLFGAAQIIGRAVGFSRT